MKTMKNAGVKRKEAHKIRRGYTITVYQTDEQAAVYGGSLGVRAAINKIKDKLQLALDSGKAIK